MFSRVFQPLHVFPLFPCIFPALFSRYIFSRTFHTYFPRFPSVTRFFALFAGFMCSFRVLIGLIYYLQCSDWLCFHFGFTLMRTVSAVCFIWATLDTDCTELPRSQGNNNRMMFLPKGRTALKHNSRSGGMLPPFFSRTCLKSSTCCKPVEQTEV